MDGICGAVLDRIFELSPAGRYVIIAEDEFYEAFPEESDRNYEELKRALSTLRGGGYIDVKYARGAMYCVAPLKRYEEEAFSPVPSEAQPKRRKIDFVLLSAFAGGALGSLIVTLISAFLQYAF